MGYSCYYGNSCISCSNTNPGSIKKEAYINQDTNYYFMVYLYYYLNMSVIMDVLIILKFVYYVCVSSKE